MRLLSFLLFLSILFGSQSALAQYRLQRQTGEDASSVSRGVTVLSIPARPPERLKLGRGIVGSFTNPYVARPPLRQNVSEDDLINPPERGLAQIFANPTVSEIRRVGSRDVVIVIDKSRSMEEMDCPGGAPNVLNRFLFAGPGGRDFGAITRWEWCRRQTLHVASQLAAVPGSRIKLVLFDDRVEQFDHVSLQAVGDIFNRFRPSGGTNATKALKTVLNDYFESKRSYGAARPLSVVCITDGAPSSPRSLKDLLIETSIKMQSPGEIAISFLQIGDDREGNRLLPELDFGLVGEGAQFDIVSCRSFNSLSRVGLMRALLDTARTSG